MGFKFMEYFGAEDTDIVDALKNDHRVQALVLMLWALFIRISASNALVILLGLVSPVLYIIKKFNKKWKSHGKQSEMFDLEGGLMLLALLAIMVWLICSGMAMSDHGLTSGTHAFSSAAMGFMLTTAMKLFHYTDEVDNWWNLTCPMIAATLSLIAAGFKSGPDKNLAVSGFHGIGALICLVNSFRNGLIKWERTGGYSKTALVTAFFIVVISIFTSGLIIDGAYQERRNVPRT